MRALLASMVLGVAVFGAGPAWAQIDPCLADPLACAGETVSGGTEAVEETVQGGTQTVTGTVDGLSGATDDVVDAATGGGGSEPPASGEAGAGGAGADQGGSARASRDGDREDGTRTGERAAAGGVPAAARSAREAGRRSATAAGAPETTASVLERIGRAFTESTEAFVFPLALIALVATFLLLQSRFDRSDPKLALAPLDSRDEVLTFR